MAKAIHESIRLKEVEPQTIPSPVTAWGYLLAFLARNPTAEDLEILASTAVKPSIVKIRTSRSTMKRFFPNSVTKSKL
ncbi:hypothetical protein A2379_01875 [Candidatus Amesbacteria bacterium RIFOXYB1_FULL_47_13]|nr:MAG: hypothetical protein A2379_01875 [Candidatus Amesbacteria bacterium RIFOXYB1_FULL_47_13]HBC72703.1 hypothetical protein [Candidatus Amesbacteria bacterium]